MSETIMIDRIQYVQTFTDMLNGANNKRILRILGIENMGKSRLLREYRMLSNKKLNDCCALIDLRSKYQGYSDIIFQIAQQLSSIEFHNFTEAQNQLSLTTPKVDVKGLRLLLSTMSINVSDQRNDDYDRQKITASFCKDLKSANIDHPIVILFDTFDGASPKIQDWVGEQLLTALLQIPSIYIVIAGRSLPEPSSIWQDSCASFELKSVTLEDHISYCQSLGGNIDMEIIKAFHDAFDGTPGLFSMYAPKLIKEE